MNEVATNNGGVLASARRHWGKVTLIFAVLLLSSWLGTTWLAHSRTAPTFGWPNALGFAVGIWGLLLSVAGFGVTWWQLQRTQTASGAVANALARLKRDYASFDVVTEVRSARAMGEFAQTHVADRRWDSALNSYNAVRGSLIKMISVKDGLSPEQAEIAKDYVAIALDACTSIERLKDSSSDELSVEILNSKLRELDGFLIEVEFTLKDGIRG